MVIVDVLHKIKHKLLKLRLQPIRVFCFHQVSETFDASTMWECDWMSTSDFKEKVATLQKEYTFISLSEAHEKLKADKFRVKKYAVLTMDDASNCIISLIPWLADRQIPITLFIPTSFVTGENISHKCGVSITGNQLTKILKDFFPYVNIANHGCNHVRATAMSETDFKIDIQKAEDFLSKFSENTMFYAYPGGYRTKITDNIVKSENLIPVYMDNQKNYNTHNVIHREIL